MTGPVTFRVAGAPTSALLSRLVGLFAQMDLPAPAMAVSVDGGTMRVDARMASLEAQAIRMLAAKMRRAIGVDAVEVLADDPAAQATDGRLQRVPDPARRGCR